MPRRLGPARFRGRTGEQWRVSYDIDAAAKKITIELRPAADEAAVRARVGEILLRYDQSQFGMKRSSILSKNAICPRLMLRLAPREKARSGLR
jgi:hypothetical protein